MRFAAFVFSFVLIFSTVQTAYANPLIGLVIRQGLLAKTAKGAVKISKDGKKGLVYYLFGGAVGTAVGDIATYCVKNKKICKDILGDVGETVMDMIGDESAINKYDICFYGGYEGKTPEEIIDKMSKYHGKRPKEYGLKRFSNYQDVYEFTFETDFGDRTDLIICNKSDKYQNNQQIINQTINNKSDTEINNIIEKYITEIEINNYCSNGGKCDELSKEFADEVFKKLDKYDIDKIDRDNCEVKNNKIVSCRNARIDKDSDDENQTQKEKSDEDKTINCDATGFHKKVCDFIDWYQDDDGLDDNTKIDVKDDTPEPTNANIDFKATCPPPYEVNISLYGIDINFTLLDTPEVCSFLHTWIKPIMLVIAPLQAVYILGGRND